jgi:hypothetical protein
MVRRPIDVEQNIAGHASALEEVIGRLARIETMLESLARQRTVKEWFTTEEVAATMGKAAFTVREWCRHGRVAAEKRECGRGKSKEWIISRNELMRIQAEGLLPESSSYRHVR